MCACVFTILNKDLGARESPVNGSHVQGALPFFALKKEQQNRMEFNTLVIHRANQPAPEAIEKTLGSHTTPKREKLFQGSLFRISGIEVFN